MSMHLLVYLITLSKEKKNLSDLHQILYKIVYFINVHFIMALLSTMKVDK